MGFGIALFGFAFMLMVEFGGGIFSALLLGYGFYLASRLEGNFLRASISSLFMLPRGIFKLVTLFVKLPDTQVVSVIDTASIMIYLLSWLLTVYFWSIGVINIARDNNAPKFENKARRVMIITICYIIFSITVTLIGSGGFLGQYTYTLSSLNFILSYCVIIYDILMMHNCFVLITSEKEYEKDKQQLAKERADAFKKAQERKQEALKKFEKRNKK